jgi:hypothetical protein
VFLVPPSAVKYADSTLAMSFRAVEWGPVLPHAFAVSFAARATWKPGDFFRDQASGHMPVTPFPLNECPNPPPQNPSNGRWRWSGVSQKHRSYGRTCSTISVTIPLLM